MSMSIHPSPTPVTSPSHRSYEFYSQNSAQNQVVDGFQFVPANKIGLIDGWRWGCALLESLRRGLESRVVGRWGGGEMC